MKLFQKSFLFFVVVSLFSLPLQELHAEDHRIYYLPPDYSNVSYWDCFCRYSKTDQAINQFIGIGIGVGGVLYIWLTYYLMSMQNNQMKSFSGGQAMEVYLPGDIMTTFEDVAGLSGAKEDMQDIISYFENPMSYVEMGAKVPKGVLMNGGPGNGKTLLARAVAGEINCPFISISGSSFNDTFIGVGSSRVRALFDYADELAVEYGGCIIFIDEFDAVASARTALSHSENDTTVNELLHRMDGIEKGNNPVIVLAATNRAQSLDPAVLRPGRFDRIVQVNKPYVKDRIELLNIALDTVVHDDYIDINDIAHMTIGFSGAELANLINEAAIIAINNYGESVSMFDIELAYDNITLGREIKGMEQSQDKKWMTAVHEAGHAVAVLYNQNDTHAVHKVSITPRSNTLGVMHLLPLFESYDIREQDMRAHIVTCLCGSLSEEAFGFGRGTGLRSDIAVASQIAYDMVVTYGMSPQLNYISYDGFDHNLPNDIATEVHKEAQKIVNECLLQAQSLVELHKKEIEMIAELLMEEGTVFGYEIYELLGLEEPEIESI